MKSAHFRYAIGYVVFTFAVLLFLNIYSSEISQKLFYKSKETTMIDKCHLAAKEIGNLDVLNHYNVSKAVSNMVVLSDMRLVITSPSGLSIYDSADPENEGHTYILFPEIVQALEGNDVFSWDYHAGAMQSCAATPIYSYGTLTGCIYIMELDAEQGSLIQTLQKTTLITSVVLELVVFVYSLIFSTVFTGRLRKIMSSMRIIREGNYTHKVNMGGHDELSVLGEEFNDLTERLNTSEEKRRQFVSDASHELKTPLASIKLLTDSILQNDMDVDTIREFVADIGHEADRLNRMSQKLLSLSKIESQADCDCEIVCIAPTVERAVRMLSATAQKSQITIQTDLADDCPILIIEDDLYQIIFNLMENGIKYNVPGGTLTVTLHREQDNAVLQISDTGVGIPKDSVGHIFERFYRVDKARSRKSGGSGLGLSIVRNMVERNKITMHVDSEVGKGTTFQLEFPVFEVEDEN